MPHPLLRFHSGIAVFNPQVSIEAPSSRHNLLHAPVDTLYLNLLLPVNSHDHLALLTRLSTSTSSFAIPPFLIVPINYNISYAGLRPL